MKLIIAGGRDFMNYEKLRTCVDDFVQRNEVTEVVSGTARGADVLGEIYAKANGIPVKQFPANWNKHGKKAGYLRNAEMAEYADALIAFWDGKSKGTKHMIDLAYKHGLQVEIKEY